MKRISVRCCVAGGGPAGMMLGLLLARAGVDVLVLEKHGDFLRDFRGDTIHPSTLELMNELGLLDDLLKLPHQEAGEVVAVMDGVRIEVADFSRLTTRCRFIAFMPQWDFLSFLAERAARFPAFALRMRAEVESLLEEGPRVAGVVVATPDGPLEVRADLVVGADGRDSTVRAAAGLRVIDLGAPLDVLWFRLTRRAADGEETRLLFERGRIFILINRGDYWQCGFGIAKGSLEKLREKGLSAFRDTLAQAAPFLADRTDELVDWSEIKLLSVRVDRLARWYRPGLLCIGDSAHAMSPVGGVGINLAIQDAVAAANRLAEPLARGSLRVADLRAVQRRRELPARIIQSLQVLVHERVLAPALAGRVRAAPPLPFRLLVRFPALRRIPGRLIGVGFRPEHIESAVTGGGSRADGVQSRVL